MSSRWGIGVLGTGVSLGIIGSTDVLLDLVGLINDISVSDSYGYLSAVEGSISAGLRLLSIFARCLSIIAFLLEMLISERAARLGFRLPF